MKGEWAETTGDGRAAPPQARSKWQKLRVKGILFHHVRVMPPSQLGERSVCTGLARMDMAAATDMHSVCMRR